MMHREVIARKKSHVIILGLLFVTVMLYLVEYIERLNIRVSWFLDLSHISISLVIILFLAKEYLSCRISYKYSIIADRLIINRISRKHEDNLTSIRISDIVYIGKRRDIPKEFESKSTGKYTCSLFSHNACCCVYNVNGEYQMFKFQPSKLFLERLKKCNDKISKARSI